MHKDAPQPVARLHPGRPWEARALACLLGSYVVFCLIIAGLNYGYAAKASTQTRELISFIWHFYENEYKTIMILAAAVLALRLGQKTRKGSMFQANLIGITIAAALLHILGPILSGTKELYFFAMPFPWTSVPLQALDPQSTFMASRAGAWGSQGALVAFGFWLAMGVIVLVGTLILGRRWQCSTLCLFNGFASEVFTDVFPLLGKKKTIGKGLRRCFSLARWIVLAIALFYSLYWITHLLGQELFPPTAAKIVVGIETWKYLVLELMMAMLFWLVLTGRGYCQYCPLGTVLAGLGKVAGQRIDTDRATCVSCGSCNRTCPLGIDIMASASRGVPMHSSLCVGCGHCVDQCPKRTLRYSTALLRRWANSQSNKSRLRNIKSS